MWLWLNRGLSLDPSLTIIPIAGHWFQWTGEKRAHFVQWFFKERGKTFCGFPVANFGFVGRLILKKWYGVKHWKW